ncbi:MAG: GNAT family N-acetyltransferase [Hyphomicrobiales bacterium]|nr:MAG: GNAT family N-acetyltransferase [Hyphomicrobiales bacterium]
MTTIPTLETQRLILRGFTQADFEPLAAFFADEASARFVGGVETYAGVWRRMAFYIGHWDLRGYGMFALEDKSSGQFAGYCGPYNPIDWPEPEIGYGLLPAFQGKGLMTEAARRCISFAYDELGWTTAMSSIDPNNAPSRAVVERLGARFEKHAQVSDFTADIYRHLDPTEFRKTLNS